VAGTARLAGDVITAANWKAYVRDQTVNHFASTSARGSAITSPAQGMASYRDDLGSGGNIEHPQRVRRGYPPEHSSSPRRRSARRRQFGDLLVSIPGVLQLDLMLMGLGAVSLALSSRPTAAWLLNSDSGANYSSNSIDTNQGALNPTGAFNNAQTSPRWSWAFALPGTTYWGTPKGGCWTMHHLAGYANTTFRKIGLASTWQSPTAVPASTATSATAGGTTPPPSPRSS
jgi:hypothetical protein